MIASTTRRPVTLVTGASRGLGFLIARKWARAGHDVVICARSTDGLEHAAEDPMPLEDEAVPPA